MNFKSVLIVDDSEPDQFLTKTVIQKYDPTIEVHQVYNGEEALEFLDSFDGKIDLILLDINMPRMNGHEFLEAYNEKDEKSSVIVMLTSSDQDLDKEKASRFDCVIKYFQKPLSVDDLTMVAELDKEGL